MSCVNRSCKEFKELMRATKLSSEALNYYVHLWQNTIGKEGEFPDAGWVKGQARGSATIVAGPAQMELWEKKYKNPLLFNTRKEATAAYKEAAKIFDKKSLYITFMNDGRFRLSVIRPIDVTKSQVEKEDSSPSRGLMYEKSQDRNYNLNRVKEHYSVAFSSRANLETYNHYVNEILSHVKEVEFKNDNESDKDALARINEIINDVKNSKNGFIIDKMYPVKLKDTNAYKIYIKFKSFEDIVNAKLKLLENLSDDALASEALRLEQESMLNDEYYINPKKVEALKQQVRKNSFVYDFEINEAFEFLQNLENNPDLNQYVEQCIKWLKNDTIKLPRDNEKVLEAFQEARRLHIDTQKFKSPIDLLIYKANLEKVDEGDTINMSERPIFSLNRTVDTMEGTIEIYDVPDNEEGQQAVMQVLADATPKDSSGKPVMNSPWCLAVYNYDVKTKKATPTNSALNTYWPRYNKGKRQIAILNGKPIAFNSTNKEDGRDEWWDFSDHSHENVNECTLQKFKNITSGKSRNPKTTIALGDTVYTYSRNGVHSVSRTIINEIKNFHTFISESTHWTGNYIRKTISLLQKGTSTFDRIEFSSIRNNEGVDISMHNNDNSKDFILKIPYLENLDYNDIGFTIEIKNDQQIRKLDYQVNDDGSITVYSYKDSGNKKTGSNTYEPVSQKLHTVNRTIKNFNINSLDVLKKILYLKELYSHNQVRSIVDQLAPVVDIIKDLVNEIYNDSELNITEENTEIDEELASKYKEKLNKTIASGTPLLVNAVTDAVETAQLNNALNNAVENLNLPYNLNNEATNEDEVVNNETSEHPTNVENSIENNNTEVLEMTQEELSALGQEVNDFNSTDEQIEPKTIMNTLQALKEDRLTRLYNEQVKKPFNAELDRIFRNILEEYHFDIRTTNLKEMYDQDALGALDILQKVIYLSDEGDIEKVKAIAEPEEFAHAFIELMGSAYYSPKARAKYDIATREYSELRDLIETTSFYKEILEQYKNVYTYQNGNPDLVKIKKEAVGKALGATIVGKFEEKTEADKTFTKKLKKWFNDALLFFKAVFGNKSAQLQRKLDAIAESILNGSYAEKYLDKVHDTNYKLVTFKDTLAKQNARDGGKALNIIQKLNRHKSILTGSLSYRAQGTVYRSEEDNLHDLDFVVKAEDSTLYMDHPSLAHITQRKMGKWTSEMLLKAVADSPYIRSIKEDIPDFYVMYAYPENSGKCIISNNAICDDPRIITKFKSLKGNFNQRLAQLEPEEREKLYLVDIFFNKDNVVDTYSDTESDITMTDFTESFSAKLKMGRAKDLYDYQRFLPYNRKYNVKQSSKGALFFKNENSVPGERIDLNDSEGIARIKDKVKFNNIEIAGMKIPFDSKLGKFLQSESQSSGILSYFITDNNEFIENLKDSSYPHSYFIPNSRIPKEILKEELEEFSIYNGENNTYKTDEVIGLLIEAIDEDFGKVKTLFNNLKEACTNQEVLSDSHVINAISKTGELTLSNLITALHLLLDSTFSISNTTVTYEPLSQKEINFNNSEEDDTEKPAPVEERKSDKEDKHKSISDIHAEFSARIDRQMDALLDSDLISPIELRHLAEQIVNCVSDYITQAMTDPQSVSDFFNGEFDGIDFSKMSRKEIVNTIGIDKLLEACKKKFDPNSRDEDDEFYDDEDTLAIAKEVMKNWDALLYMASDVFRSNEDFSIVTDDGLTHTTEDSTVLNADELEVSDDEDDVNEHEGSQQMHWQIKMTTLDTLRTMSQEVKDALRQLYILDEHGNPVYDRFGIRERINVRKATQSILRWGQGSVTLSNLVTALKEKEQSNPWLKPLIKKLSEKNGEYATFQSQFWGTFDKHFITMSIVRKQDGMYISQAVNEHPALSEVAKQIEIAYNIGEHPLFEPSGVNTESLKQLSNDYDTLRNLRNSDFNKPENVQKIYEALVNATNLLGYNIPIEMVENALKLNNQNLEDFKSMYEALGYIIKSIEAGSKKEDYNPFKFKDRNSINGNLRAFLRPLTDTLEDTMINAVYDDGEMHQSYITPSWLSNMFVKFTRDEESFKKYIESEFGTSEWYKKDGAWRQPWIEAMVQNPAFRKIFKHKIQLNFDGSNYMKTMDDLQYTLSVFAEYFTKGDSKESMTTAWYRVPMQSNKPTSEFIQFMSYRGPFYKNSITTGMIKIFSQELDRIVTVMLRNKDKTDPDFIKNFDTKGKKFVLLDFMNSYLEGGKKANTEFGKALQAEINNRIQKVRDPEHSSTTKNTELEASLQTIIKEEMEAKVNSILESWKNKGVIEAAKKIENIGKSDAEVTANLENFIWNDTFAAMNILELTVVDPAYYADAEDLQKRLAQIHAPGIRGNAEATDFKGNSVTDGKVRTFYLNDFDDVTSNVIDNLTEVFDRKIREAKGVEKEGYKALKEALVGAKGVYRQINVTDAQAYNCPTSYRKKAFIFGKWSKRAEDVYNRILRNEHPSYTEIQEAFQPLKPFAYSQVAKESGVVGAPIQNLKMGIQNKNAEYLLIMADAILKGEQTSKPNLLRAIYEVMEDSHKNADGTVKVDGIDTVQFNSAVKTGPRNGISVKDLINNPNGEAILKSRINQSIYKWDTKQVTNENSENNENTNVHTKTSEYNSDYIHELDLDGYCLQQEVPAHFMEHEQSHGSQIRAILPSDLAITDVNGNAVTYHTDKGDVTAKEFIEDYENTIAENINASIDNLKKEFNLPIDNNGLVDQRDVNKAISRVLQHEILTSPRYGMDLYQACSIDENGNFKIPLGDPIQSKRIEQLINSIIKKRVNKQEIAGGPVVQVSSFGTSNSLHIKFKNKNGGKLLSREEWKEAKEKEKLEAPTTVTNTQTTNNIDIPILKKEGPVDTDLNTFKDSVSDIDNNEEGTTNGLGNTYEEYLKNNQGGIDYFEVYAPIYSKELLEKFADEKGNIDIKSIEALDPDLLKMVGYRIPTEAKYSAAPLKIVGFLPREAGDAIMMPEEITAINGSDFDVDKMYLMRKVLNIKKNDISRSKLHRLLYDELVNSQKSKLSYNTKLSINDLINQFLDNPYAKSSLVNQETAQGYMSMPEAAYEKLLKTYLQNKYTVEKPTKGKLYRDNKIVDMTYEVLTHATSADQVLNPQDFSAQKRAGYMIEAYRQGYDWEYLKSKSISELKDLISTEKNLSYIDTHIQFYKQNSSAASLLGIFAVNRVAHAIIETSHPHNDNRSTYAVDIADEDSFSLLGHIFSGRMDFDMRKSWDGELIGKTLGSLVGASADAVKDPILNLMNVNKETVNVLNTLARFGMPFDQVALFISQSSLAKVVDKYNSNKLKGIGGSISDIIEARIKEITRDFGIDKNSRIQYEDLTEEELIKGLRVNNTTEDAKIEFKVLNTFKKLQNIASSTRLLNTATRVNSISSAVGPLIVDNLIYENQVNDLNRRSAIYERTVLPDGREIYRKSTVQSVIEANPILKGFSQGYSLARQLLRKMPAYSVGFSNIIDIAETECKPLITDRKSMSDLVDFYNSYLLIQSGVIDETKLEYYISEFPKEFIRNYKNNEKYKDNPLIQAIRLSEDNGKRAALAVNTMGADSDFIQNLSMGWLSLYKSDKELAMKLFEYNFFRGGIGFSPKTFMRLLPVRMKTDIEGYLETYRTLPMVDPHLVLNQFVRNNWRNNRIVPVKDITINVSPTNKDTKNTVIEIRKSNDVKLIRGVHYFKKGVYNQLTGKTDYTVYENISYNDEEAKVMYITELDTLGANNDYIEMSTEPIYDHAVITTKTDVKTSEKEQQNLRETQQQLDKQMDPENDSILGDGELSEKDIADASAYYDSINEDSNEHRYTDEELEDLLVRSFSTLPGIETREQAIARINDQKEGISNTRDPEKLASNQVKYENFFKNKLMQLGITPNEDLLKELYKKLC
jgi:hypothetical protein